MQGSLVHELPMLLLSASPGPAMALYASPPSDDSALSRSRSPAMRVPLVLRPACATLRSRTLPVARQSTKQRRPQGHLRLRVPCGSRPGCVGHQRRPQARC